MQQQQQQQQQQRQAFDSDDDRDSSPEPRRGGPYGQDASGLPASHSGQHPLGEAPLSQHSIHQYSLQAGDPTEQQQQQQQQQQLDSPPRPQLPVMPNFSPSAPGLTGLAADLAGVPSADGGVYAASPHSGSPANAARHVMPRGGAGSAFTTPHASPLREQYGLALQLAGRQPTTGGLPPVDDPFAAARGSPLSPTDDRQGSVTELAATPGVRGKAFGARRGLADEFRIPPPSRISQSWGLSGAAFVLPGSNPFDSDGGSPVVVQGGPEPDYGMVSELKAKALDDPFGDDFGLAAEVGRRKDRERSPFANLGAGSGRRRQMLPVGIPTGDSLDAELLRRQDMLVAAKGDPFSAANMASAADPFDLVGENLQVPEEPREEQEFPEGRVPVLVPGDATSETGFVSGDDDEYGLAKELGATGADGKAQRAAAREARRQLEAMGITAFDAHGRPIEMDEASIAAGLPRYVYDMDTGLLHATDAGKNEGRRVARQYIEDRATGDFFRINATNAFFNRFKRKIPLETEEDEEEEEESSFRTKLRTFAAWLTNVWSMLGLFAQGVGGGFALLNLYMTYILYSGDGLKDFFRYYGYVALSSNRIYFAMLALSIVAAGARVARDKLRDFQPRKLWLGTVDGLQIVCYLIAYVATVVITPMEDSISYEYRRNPYFYTNEFNAQFQGQLAWYHALNIVRSVFFGFGFLLVCYQNAPATVDGIASAQATRRWNASAALARAAAALANQGKHPFGAGTR